MHPVKPHRYTARNFPLPMHTRTLVASVIAAASLPILALAASGDTVDSSSSSAASSSADTASSETQYSSAASVGEGFGSVEMDQEDLNGAFGKWQLLKGGVDVGSGAGASASFDHLAAGLYSVFIEAPSGASTSVRLFSGNDALQNTSVPQLTFTLQPDQTLRVSIHYQYTKLGSVGVTSDPVGISFTLTEPDGTTKDGMTPQSYDSVPEGQYKVKFHPPSGCGDPPAKGSDLQPGSRISFTISLSCKAADDLRARQGNQNGTDGSSPYLTVTVGNNQMTFKDIQKTDWFAAQVSAVVRAGVMSGYKDGSGNLTGEFGPGNSVTVAELAHIAHQVAGIPETSLQAAKNPLAQDAWFAGTIASAEELGWTIYADGTIDPTRPATRGEVLVTLLQAFNVPLSWQKGNVFSDVPLPTPYAAAIETAAKLGIVAGTQTGSGTTLFHPVDPINRAEMSKILATAMLKLHTGSSSSSSAQ